MALFDNLWLPVLLSALAALHAYLALDAIGRMRNSRGAVTWLWLGFGAAVLAVGVWATRAVPVPVPAHHRFDDLRTADTSTG